MKQRLAIAVGIVAALAAAAPAFADEGLAPLIMHRSADAGGGCIEIHSGLTSDSCDDLYAHFGAASPDVAAVSATETPAEADASATAPTSPIDQPVTFSMKQAILRARDMLQKRLADEQAAHPKAKTVEDLNSWVDVTLAVWNAKTDDISLVTVQKAGAKLKMDPVDDADFDIAVRYTNGVNSQFAVASTAPESDVHVVAVEYPIFSDKIWLSRRHYVYRLTNVVYSPYSKDLVNAETLDWGKQTLDGDIADVYAELRNNSVMSRAFPGKLMADVVDPDILRDIVMIEHLGPNALLKGDPTAATEAVYVTLAINQDDAYAYAKSTAGALGMFQFIPSTYKLMTARTDLNLIKDFETGMRDPHNAIKAAVGYLDAELASMPLAVRDLYKVDPDRVGEYLAAAYNGGGARVHKAIAIFGDGWSDGAAQIAEMRAERAKGKADIASLTVKAKKADAKTLKSIKAQISKLRTEDSRWVDRIEAAKKAVLRTETADYVKKYRVVMQLLKPAPAVTLASAS